MFYTEQTAELKGVNFRAGIAKFVQYLGVRIRIDYSDIEIVD